MLKSSVLKTGVLILVFAVLLLTAGAVKGNADPTSTTQEINGDQKKEISLTLEESIKMALENHPDIAVAKIEHEQARADLRQARRTARTINDLRREGIPLYSYDNYLAERVLPVTMEMLEKLADKTLEFRINLLKFQVENAYYGVLKAERELQNAMDSLARAREQLRLAKVGLDVGVNAQVDVLGAEVLVASQELAVAFANNSLKQARMDFNNLVGLTLDDKVKLTSSFNFTPQEFNLDEIKEMAKEKDLNYIQLHENYKVQQETFNLAKGYYTPNVFTYQEAERNYNIAKLKLENVDQELELKIRKAYLNTETAKERYKLMEKSVEQAKEIYRLTKLRYEVGMATLLDIEKASGELDNAKAELLSAVYDYNLAAVMLQHGLFDLGGIGNGR